MVTASYFVVAVNAIAVSSAVLIDVVVAAMAVTCRSAPLTTPATRTG